MKIIYQLTLAAMLLTSTNLFAQDASIELPVTDPATEVPAAEEKEEEEPSFSLTGYVDAYYQGNPGSSDAEGEPTLILPTSFTGDANTFGIGNVNLLAEKSVGKVSFVGQIGFGPRATQANGGSGNFSSTVQQLYVTYAPSDAVTFTLGNFGTFVGYEVIDAPANMNYSTSYLFSNGPFYHTGAKVDFAIAEGFGAMVGIFNDTDSKVDAVEGKHIGAQLSAEAGGLAAYLNFLAGKEADNGEDDDMDQNGFQVDLTATYEVSESFMLGLNVSDKSSSIDGNTLGGFTGAALYATAGLSESFDLSFRGEYFAEKEFEGQTFDSRSVTAFTVSGNFKQGDLRIVPEVRFDSGANFTEDNIGSGIDFGGALEDDSVISLILAAIYSF